MSRSSGADSALAVSCFDCATLPLRATEGRPTHTGFSASLSLLLLLSLSVSLSLTQALCVTEVSELLGRCLDLSAGEVQVCNLSLPLYLSVCLSVCLSLSLCF